ncbi:MAG: class II aldolase/adducin family protein, partial [Pseudomonadota bacterium]
AVYAVRPDVHAIVHAHPVHATAVAIARHMIPAIHYMIAAFGGPTIPLAGYALFGSDALAEEVATAIADRDGCLMANHGALALGDTLDRAAWRMGELETLAHQYILTDFGARAHILSDAEVQDALTAFAGYGLKD